jgi:NHLM bacteriocin system ABC transporter peptidase/ATP-binding protein
MKRVRTPTVLQFEAVECGAAALAILLAHYRRFVPLEELRLACGVSRDGSKATNVVKAARHYGMDASGFRRSVEQLETETDPFIVFWNFNHFLVVEGTSRDWIYLNDPASGPRKVTREEFNKSYTGVALLMKPGPGFAPGGTPPNLLGALRRRLAGSYAALAFTVLVGLTLVVPGLLEPVFRQVYIDKYLVNGLDYWIKPMLWIMGLVVVGKAFLVWLQQYYLMRFQVQLAVRSSCDFLWHVLRLPVDFFNQRYAGEIGNRVALNDDVASLLTGELATTFVNLLMIVFYAALMFSYQWQLTLVGIFMAALNLAALKYVSRARVDGNNRLLREQGNLVGVTLSGLGIIETIKASGMENDFFARFAGEQANVVNSSQALGAKSMALDHVPVLLYSLNAAVVLCLGAYDVMLGLMSIGMLLAFQSLMASFMAPFNGLVDMGSRIQSAQGNMNRLDDVLAAAPEPAVVVRDPRLGQGPFAGLSKLRGTLELRNVSFGYSPLAPPFIRDFNLHIDPGRRVALVGGSGSGKSTIANLVCGLYKPWSGEIRVGGFPRDDVPRPLLVSSLARVSQEIFLFKGSIMDNLTLWDPTLGEEDVVRAAQIANIEDAILARPGGFYGPLEEGGANFSGGQRQRLEIARALAVRPSILVLDEATSALDALTEARIDSNLRRNGCTCLIIAHRLSTIRDCDEIIVLQNGAVAERGTHDQLLALGGAYAKLVSAG